MKAQRLLGALFLALGCAAAACDTASTIEDRSCPCTSGYTCCAPTNTCLGAGSVCVGTSGTSGTTGGTSGTSGTGTLGRSGTSGGTSGTTSSSGDTPSSVSIGPDGGEVALGSGATLKIPAGALATATTISLASTATPSIDASEATAIGGAVEGSPDGQTFLKPIEIVLPYEDALVPVGTDVGSAKMLMAAKGSTSFTALDSTVDKATHTVHATTTHFTTFVPTVPTPPTDMTITSVQVQMGSGDTAGLDITGSNLPPGGDAEWDGSIGDTIYQGWSSTLGKATVYARATQGAHKLRILRYGASGVDATSNVFDVVIGGSSSGTPPTLTSITPSTTTATVNDLPLHVVGTGFTSASKVNGLPTTFVSSTALDTVIPGESLGRGGSYGVTVTNPAPSGGTSNAINLTIQATPGPELSGMKPQTIAPGAADFTLKISSGVASQTSQIIFGSTTLATTVSNDGLGHSICSATVPASLVATARRVGVGLFDPAKGSSGLLPFDVMGGLPCSATNVDLDGESGNGCETDVSAGPTCVTLRRGGCFLKRTVEHPLFAKSGTGIFTNSPGLSQLTGAAYDSGLPLFTQQGSSTTYAGTSYAGSQLDTSTGQLTFSGARGGIMSPSDACPLGWPPLIQVKCAGSVTLVPLSDLAKK